jgi:hypothetical protein
MSTVGDLRSTAGDLGSTTVTLISDNEELAAFRDKEPQGYIIMNGYHGIGLVGELAAVGRTLNEQRNSDAWVEFADTLLPIALNALQQRYGKFKDLWPKE